jgi:hypothetical protein
MPDDSATPKSLDARLDAAVRQIEKRLIAKGTNPDASKQRAEAVRDRLSLAGKGPIRVLRPLSSGEFYAGSFEDPLGVLVEEIFHGIPDEEKLIATRQRDEQVEAMVEEKRNNPRNWAL